MTKWARYYSIHQFQSIKFQSINPIFHFFPQFHDLCASFILVFNPFILEPQQPPTVVHKSTFLFYPKQCRLYHPPYLGEVQTTQFLPILPLYSDKGKLNKWNVLTSDNLNPSITLQSIAILPKQPGFYF